MFVHTTAAMSTKVEWDQNRQKMWIGLSSDAYIAMHLDDAKRLYKNLGRQLQMADTQGSVKDANE